MKTKEYDLENLLVIFKEHSIESKKNHGERIKDYKKYYPEEALPSHLEDFFNFPLALIVICEEILKLKKN